MKNLEFYLVAAENPIGKKQRGIKRKRSGEELTREQVAAIKAGDLYKFFDAVKRSGDSSWKLLQNVYARPNQEQMAMGLLPGNCSLIITASTH